MRGLIANAHNIRVDGPALPRLFQKIGVEVIAAIAMPFLLLMLAALAGNMIQHRLVWSTEALTPQAVARFRRSPASSGCSPTQALANFVKGLVKLVLVGAVLTALLWPERDRIDGLVAADPVGMLPLTQSLALKLLGAVVAIWRWSRPPTTCSSTGSGTSGRRCRCAK